MATTRRELATGILAGLRAMAGMAPPRLTPVNFEVPAHACDCHTHIFGDPVKFPMAADRGYTPEPASPEQMTALHKALHMERVVIVTPSVYGADNSATLYGIKARGATARGIAVIGENPQPSELDAMGKAGIRGIRLNLSTAGVTDVSVARRRFQGAVNVVADRGWHIQINANLAMVAGLKDVVLASPVPVVFDHFAGAQAVLGVGQAGFADLVEMVRSGKAYVKVSAAYRVSSKAPDFPDVAPLAKALIAANADRVVWGTDWPHPDGSARAGRKATDVRPGLPVDDGRVLNLLAGWAPDAGMRKKILVENPARLYGF